MLVNPVQYLKVNLPKSFKSSDNSTVIKLVQNANTLSPQDIYELKILTL